MSRSPAACRRGSATPWVLTAAGCFMSLAVRADPASDVCSLATDVEFQQAQGIDPRIGVLETDPPVLTEMVWGPHCDYSPGAIDLFTKRQPEAELDRVLGLTNGGKQRLAVPGLGERAFFTTIYPEDEYRRRGLLAIFLGHRILVISMDPVGEEPLETTRPGLEGLAKRVLPRLK